MLKALRAWRRFEILIKIFEGKIIPFSMISPMGEKRDRKDVIRTKIGRDVEMVKKIDHVPLVYG